MRGVVSWLVLLLGLGSAGCVATSLGASAGRASPFGGSTPAVVTGARVAQLAQIGGDRGPVAGYELELQHQTFNQPGFAWRGQAQVGWADTPYAYKPIVGREVTMRLGYARFPRDGGVLHAVAFGPRFAVPIRIASSDEVRGSDQPSARTWMIVPEIGGNISVPPGEKIRFDFGIALSLRLHLWRAHTP